MRKGYKARRDSACVDNLTCQGIGVRDMIKCMEKMEGQKIEISIKTILFGFMAFFLVKFAWEMRDLLLSLFIGYIIMSAAKQPVETLVKKGVSRGVAVFIVFLSFFIVIGFIFSWIIPPFINETALFINHFPRIIENVRATLPVNINSLPLTQYIPNITTNFISVIGSVFSNVTFFATTIFFSIYLTLDSGMTTALFSRFIDKKNLERIEKIEKKIEERLGMWLLGELFLMLIIGTVSYVGFLLLGVRYALPLGIIAGLLEAIPNIGPTIAAVPAFLVGFSQTPLLGLFTIFLAVGLQQFENHIIVPLVMKRVVGLHPILTLIVLIVGGRYAGVLGILFAIPLALVVETIILGLQE